MSPIVYKTGSMSKQIIKAENRQITKAGENILEELRQSWGQYKVKRVVSAMKDGCPAFVEKTFVVDSPNKRLNEGISPEVFHHFASMVKPEDEDRISNIVKAGCFEVNKALQAFEIAPMVATDNKIKPVTWDQAAALNSPSIATLVKYKGEGKAEALIYMMTFAFAKKFGRRNDLDESQIEELAAEIVVEYRSLSIADLKMIFTNTLRASKKMFNLDFQGIMAVLEESRQDKLEYATRKAIDDHARFTSDEKQHRRRKRPEHATDPDSMAVMMKQFSSEATIKKQNASS